MGEYEIPLVIFTVLSQWAVGIILAVVLIEWIRPTFMESVGKKALQIPVISAFILSVIGTIVSMFHLGSPLRGYTSVIGQSHSWLSREIIAVILFNIFLVGLVYVWWKKVDQTNLRKLTATLTALMGVFTIINSAAVYFSIVLHPTWHNWTTFANFLLTGFLLGALTVAYFSLKASNSEIETKVTKLLGGYLAIIVAALLVTIAASAMISNGAIESQFAATISFTSVLFWIRVLGSLLIPAILVMVFMFGRKVIPMKFVLAATGFVLIGELSGRMMFYYSVMSQYPWF